MMVYEKIYQETYLNNQYIWLQNNTEQIHFILERTDLCWNFSNLLGNALNIH